MVRFILLFVILGVGLFIGTQYSGQQGYVLISIADKTIEMSVTTLVIFVILFLAALFAVEFIIKKTLRVSSNTWNWFSVRKLKRSRRLTNEGIIKLLEGDWKQAEKKVTRWANHHDMPLLCYLIASEAAQGQGDNEKRDHYLELAAKEENSTLAVELTRAKQQIQGHRYELALATLHNLVPGYGHNPVLLGLLKTTYIHLAKWEALMDLLPKLKKAKLIEEGEQEQLTQQSYAGVLSAAADEKGSEGVIAQWNTLGRKVKGNTKLIAHFAELLSQHNGDNEAFTVIKESIKKYPSPELYTLLPQLNLADRHPAIVLLSSIIEKDSNNAEAHSALARFYLKDEKWQDAQTHFEAALKLRASVKDYAYLADALDKQNKIQAAHDVSRQALALIEPDNA
jgi:HemY protein